MIAHSKRLIQLLPKVFSIFSIFDQKVGKKRVFPGVYKKIVIFSIEKNNVGGP